MGTNHNTAEIVNDLVRINKDRVEGYQKAIKELRDEDRDLHILFESFIADSKENISVLEGIVRDLGEDPAKDTTVSGKVYRVWMDVKTSISGHDRASILSACEYGEDAAQNAYKKALESEDELPGEIYDEIEDQKESLLEAHNNVKVMRDAEKVVK